jgi:hypothetical protein
MMTQSFTDTSSVLGIEIGSQNTRAVLFDVVAGSYHLLACGVVHSTQKAPFFDIGESVLNAITQLQRITGRTLMDRELNLITPAQRNGEGVDRLFLTVSGGPEFNLVTFGLLNEVSLESVNRLAQSTYGVLKDSFGINDRRATQEQMAALLAARPDVVLFGGGTDRGASRSIVRIAQMLALVLSTLPADGRPEILYCGNRAVSKSVVEILERQVKVTVTENIRPTLEKEELRKAGDDLSKLVMRFWAKRIEGLSRISPLCTQPPSLASLNYQKMMRFLGKLYDPGKAVLGIDLGSNSSIFTTSNASQCHFEVLPVGMGDGLERFLNNVKIADISKWLTENISEEEAREYLWQKTLSPGSIPADEKGIAIELAAARAILEYGMRDLKRKSMLAATTFEPIFAGGTTITHAPTPQQILLTLLDGIQPAGITPLIIDKHGLMSILGAIAHQNPLLPVQVMESSAFTNLATVINLESKLGAGATVANARLTYRSGNYLDLEVKQGAIGTLPLATGEVGTLTFNLARRTRVEGLLAPGEPFKVHGGICGVVIDARGRPLPQIKDIGARIENYKRWMFMLGA